MDNERHALETAPAGHFLADNGEAIKKSCETCGYYYHYQEYSHHEFGCELNDGENTMQNLPTFPFKNGCKHFEPHYIYLVDWEAELKKDHEDHAICEHLQRGKCFKMCGCESAVQNRGDQPACGKVQQTA